jgi:hypothetical protein
MHQEGADAVQSKVEKQSKSSYFIPQFDTDVNVTFAPGAW